MYDPKSSVYSNEMTPKGDNYNDETQIDNGKNINQQDNFSRSFNFLELNCNDSEKFFYEGKEEEKTIIFNKGEFDYIICVLLKDDSHESSTQLESTINAIYENFNSLQSIGIGSKNTLVCVFIKQIKSFSLFNSEDIKSQKDKNYFLYLKAKKTGNQTSTINIFTKPKGLTDLGALKCFYLGIVDQLKEEKKILFTSVITAGVWLKSLKNLILSAYNKSNNNAASVGVIKSEGERIYSMVEQYERIHFNIYNMNFYGMSAVVPLSSLLSTIAINDNCLRVLKNYYSRADENQTIDYHDYNVALFLYKNKINVKFYPDEVGSLKHNLSYWDYQEIWVNRYSGYYGNFIALLNEFINCENFNILKKIILFFQIIGFLIEFIYPSLSSMVIYSILYEAFGTIDYRLATFFTMLYIFMLVASGMCSLVSNNPHEMRMANFFLYIFMEVYYLFVLICSVIAMDNLKKNKTNNEYKFNNAAISCIIIFTFIPYVIPMLMKSGFVIENLLNMLTYIGLGAPCSTSNFLMAEVFNAAGTSGGIKIDERKGIVLIIFFLYNLFFGCLTFYNVTRRKRAECIMGFGIFYLLYNFFKIIGIIINLLSKDDAVDPKKNNSIINSIKNELGKDEDDFRSESRKLKNSNQYNNNFNNVYDDDNNNNIEYNNDEYNNDEFNNDNINNDI